MLALYLLEQKDIGTVYLHFNICLFIMSYCHSNIEQCPRRDSDREREREGELREAAGQQAG